MYKQALLDAKAVRASAMANAKASLQEAFEPKIQEMIRLKLSEELEELDEELDEDENDPYSEKPTRDEMGTQDQGEPSNSEEDTAYKKMVNPETTGGSLAEDEYEMDEASLEEILAELDELAGEKKPKDELKEGEDDEENADEEEGDDEEEGGDDEEATEEEAPSDDTKVIDITLGDLKQVLQSIQGGDMESGSDEGEEDIDLGSEEETSDEELEEFINLDEILSSLEEAKMKDKKEMKKEEKDKEEEKAKKELKEAVKTINILRKELNEVNLLNAKLLYMNKIFKSKNLSESQKVNVVSALDRASNTKEAKNIYETLKETIAEKRSQIQESRGFASKPAGVAPKKPILEADAFVNRWQKIAGIK